MKDNDTDDDWIAKRVAAAAALLDEKPLPATLSLLTTELRLTMSQRSLKQSELADLASRLLRSTVSEEEDEGAETCD